MNDPNFDDEMRRSARDLNLGALGTYSHGSLGPGDQGELRAAITDCDGKIILNFGKSLSWVAMTPKEAICLANLLIEQAKKMM